MRDVLDTKILKIDPDNLDIEKIEYAAGVIRKGGIVAVPTETVYGLAVNQSDKKAVESLYVLKNRPQEKASAIHVCELRDLKKFDLQISKAAYKLMCLLWPGPLTVVLKTADGSAVGFRCPDNKITRSIIRFADVPVVIPSANISGHMPSLNADEVAKEFNGKIDLIVDGGASRIGVSSTVIDATSSDIKVLREGAVSSKQIDKLINSKIILFVCTGNTCRSFMAEVIFNHLALKMNKNIKALSCGTSATSGFTPSQDAIFVLEQIGLKTEGYKTKRLSAHLVDVADVVLTMDTYHKQQVIDLVPGAIDKTFLLKEYRSDSAKTLDTLVVNDPIGHPVQAYKECMHELKREIERIINFF